MFTHARVVSEQVTILALALRAGLASDESNRFAVQPSSLFLDHHRSRDLFLLRNGDRIRVDVTASGKYMGRKIERSVEHARRGHGWVFILKVDFESAMYEVAGIGKPDQERCFNAAIGRITDSSPIAFSEACPTHGNSCQFARELWAFGVAIHRTMEDIPNPRVRQSVKPFLMEIPKPPFK